MTANRLTPADVGCWVLKSTQPPADLVPGWFPGTARELDRCLRRSYRLELMTPGQPCLLWLSGRRAPGVHAIGALAGEARERAGGPEVVVRLTLLADPVPRANLVADPAVRDAEVLRVPVGPNPSVLSPRQYAALRRYL